MLVKRPMANVLFDSSGATATSKIAISRLAFEATFWLTLEART